MTVALEETWIVWLDIAILVYRDVYLNSLRSKKMRELTFEEALKVDGQGGIGFRIGLNKQRKVL